MMNVPSPIEKSHNLDCFDCGNLDLNGYLKKFALANHKNDSAKTYVTTIKEKIVVGYYSLAYGSVSHDEVPSRISRGLAKHPIPVMILAKLAVDLREQNKGIGKGLLKSALLRTFQVAEIAGLRAVLVHAKNQIARDFYIKFGFTSSSVNEFCVLLLMKDLRKMIQNSDKEKFRTAIKLL